MHGFPASPSRVLLLASLGLLPVLSATPAAADPGIPVSIDIRPGDDANRIPLSSRGCVTVALLGSADFDASAVDASSVRFGPGAAAIRRGRGRLKDVNRDGHRDLVLRFRVRDAGLRAADPRARLSGRTAEGRPFAADDAIAPCRPPAGPVDPSLVLQFAGTDLDRDGGDGLDAAATTASFNDAVPGAVAARIQSAPGDGSLGDFDPAEDVTLSTDSPEAVDGAFRFRSIRIREGVTVRITGSLPARLLSLRSTIIEGTLDASGAAGASAELEAGTPELPVAPGGAGGPGAGAGGSSLAGTSLTEPGGAGGDGRNGGGGGGAGGLQKLPVDPTWNFGGGGGGGGMAGPGGWGEAGNFPSYPEGNAPGGAGGAPGGILPTSAATADGAEFHLLGVGGSGGGAGGNSACFPEGAEWRNGAAGGGGGGGGLLLRSGGDVVVKNAILARGGHGGNVFADPYAGAAGGGGSGGTIAILAGGRVDLAGGTLDVSGGEAGAFLSGWQGGGGDGASGRIHVEDADGTVEGTGSAVLLPDFTSAPFRPASGASDAPSVFTGAWFALPAGASRVLPFAAADFRESVPAGSTVAYEVEMAAEDGPTSGWLVVRDAAGVVRDPTAALNGKGYRFLRVRMTFTVPPGRTAADPLPFVESLRIPLSPY